MAGRFTARRRAPTGILVAFLALALATGARAQETEEQAKPAPSQSAATPGQAPTAQKGGARGAAQTTPPAAAEQHRLPADSTTKHTLALPGRNLSFTATAGSIRLFDEKGEGLADVAHTSYQLDGTDRATRPVTFLFNGGPGASSAWLQLGDAGPWRLSITGEGAVASASPDLLPNAETWLDFTDLVFIDPVGTGYSRFVATGDDVRRSIYSVDGDVEAISVVIRRWLEKNDRLLSPKYVTGESYGGIRGPKIVHNLQTKQGVGVRGLILVSPVLDFRDWSGSSLLQFVARLPTMAAVAREAKGPVTHKDLADVERYARGEYLVDLVKGQADAEATNRIADKVASLTGIDAAVTRRLAGRFSVGEFRREFDRKNGKVTGRYDASVTGFDPYPELKLRAVRRSQRRSADRAVDQRGRRSHHAQAELAAGRLVPPAQRRRRQCLEFRARPQPGRVGVGTAAVAGARSEAEALGRPRAVRSRHAVFRHAHRARPVARLCEPRPHQVRGLSGRAHVLFARGRTEGVSRRGPGADEVTPRSK